MKRRTVSVAALAALLGSPAWARRDPPGPPDPATLELPDLTPSRDPKVIEAGWKYFYFHKAGVSYAEAYEDFSECYRYLPVAGANPLLPMFAPWRESPGVEYVASSSNFGLIGMGIAALVAGPINRRAQQAPLRRCLETRGYVRYPLTEAVWSQLVDGYSPRSIALQAKAASLPAPDSQPVTR